MRYLISLFLAVLGLLSNLAAQTRVLQGRVIAKDFEALPGIEILNDTNRLGFTDIDGRFRIQLSKDVKSLVVVGVGFERADILLNDQCDTLEIILLYAATYDFMSATKIDRLRLREFNELPELYNQAYTKGLFKNSTACYSRQFTPHKSVLDSISRELGKLRKENKIRFEELKVGDTVKIPFSTQFNTDGTHRTMLIVYSIYAYKASYPCVVEAVILAKNRNKKAYNLVCRITGTGSCDPESVYMDKVMKTGTEFVHNMRYFKVLPEYTVYQH